MKKKCITIHNYEIRASMNDKLFKPFENDNIGVEANEEVHVEELPPNAILFGRYLGIVSSGVWWMSICLVLEDMVHLSCALQLQWKVWRRLINRTGHGYDPVSGTFDWLEDVRENSIVVNYEAKKYKSASLHHRDLLEKLFDGLSATGDFTWSLGMASAPSTQQLEYVLLPNDINIDDTQVSQARVDYTWEGDAIPSYEPSLSPVREPTPGSIFRTHVSKVGVRTQLKEKRSVVAVQPLKPTELVQTLISALTTEETSSTSVSNDDTTSKILKVLMDMVSSYEIDNTLFFKCLKFLGGKDEHNYRVIFLGLEQEQRLGFLKVMPS
ncbi:hypothetical protein GIB67_029126 [Kingdonia uniflora]|uniref:Uncharacterized protein n=1 Tax=Kingdonia uniflora TaxID=39325 RepID=A0A7J7NII9_9MAGN|nr:hypothetical protein GIB67_029126 [Kingdonia uniflora]